MQIDRWGFCVCLGACLAGPVAAQVPQEPDAEGCKDTPLLSRLPGCKIIDCSNKEFDAAKLLVGPFDNGTGDYKYQELEGKVDLITYVCPTRLSSLQIVRNAESALKGAGYRTLFSGKGLNEEPVVTTQNGSQWLQVHAQPYNEFSGYVLTGVKVQGMVQEMQATADQMAAEISKSGHVAVYGIQFDTGSARLKPNSEPVLAQILALLQKNPAWKLRVEGHTDSVGAKVANQTLSEQRAASVVAWLTGKGIPAARLTPQGFGDSKPVAPNTSEDGRAKNRRVELVKL